METKNDQYREILITKIEEFFQEMITYVRSFSKNPIKSKHKITKKSPPKIPKSKKPSFNAYLLYFKENHKYFAENNSELG